MTVVRDPIFEQHYQKKVQELTQAAFTEGRAVGINQVLGIAYHLSNENKKLINFNELVAFLKHAFNHQADDMSKEETTTKPVQVLRVDMTNGVEEPKRPKGPPKLEIV